MLSSSDSGDKKGECCGVHCSSLVITFHPCCSVNCLLLQTPTSDSSNLLLMLNRETSAPSNAVATMTREWAIENRDIQWYEQSDKPDSRLSSFLHCRHSFSHG